MDGGGSERPTRQSVAGIFSFPESATGSLDGEGALSPLDAIGFPVARAVWNSPLDQAFVKAGPMPSCGISRTVSLHRRLTCRMINGPAMSWNNASA